MKTVSATIQIDTPPAKVWAVLTDLVLTDLAAYPRRGVPRGVLPGLSWRAVAMQDLRLARVPGGGGAVGVEHEWAAVLDEISTLVEPPNTTNNPPVPTPENSRQADQR